MLAVVVRTLRRPRYASLFVGVLVLALCCIAAGTFEIHRFREKVHDNRALTANAHAAPVTPSGLVPFTSSPAAGRVADLRFRTVRATGTYLTDRQTYLDDQNQNGHQGFAVITPLQTSDGILLVDRGFIAAVGDERRPSLFEPPPAGQVTVLARLSPASTTPDRLGTLGDGEITTVNAAAQASRLGQPVYAAYGSLIDGQPGSAGLGAEPGPDLSNPSGGAGEVQLLSYVFQWYAFALLALSAPFFFRHKEVAEARAKFLGVAPGDGQFDLEAAPVRAELDGAPEQGPAGVLATRSAGALAERVEPGSETWQRAARIADRYGLDLGDAPLPADVTPVVPRRAADAVDRGIRPQASPTSEDTPHRAIDEYHGSYNDYLWQLALADGSAPDTAPREDEAPEPPPRVDIAPTVIQHQPRRRRRYPGAR